MTRPPVAGLLIDGPLLNDVTTRRGATVVALRRLHRTHPRLRAVLGSPSVGQPTADRIVAAVSARPEVPSWNLLATVDVTTEHPYNLARRSLSARHLAGPGVGIALAGLGDATLAPVTPLAAGQYVRTIRELWNSWPYESIVGDRTSGIYADLGAIRRVAETNEDYRVRGPLGTPSAPDGEPLLAQWLHASGDEMVDGIEMAIEYSGDLPRLRAPSGLATATLLPVSTTEALVTLAANPPEVRTDPLPYPPRIRRLDSPIGAQAYPDDERTER